MDTPAFEAKKSVRSALSTLVLYFLFIVISSLTMVKPAQAAGTVIAPSWQGYISWAGAQQSTYLFATSEIKIDAMIESAFPEAVTRGKQFLHDLYAARGWNCPIRVEFPPTYGQSGGTYWIEYGGSCPYQSVGVATYEKMFIMGSCPAHSTGMTTCTCNDGYTPDTTQTSCVIAACPDHASGMPCTCDTGYKFDAAGTSCISTCPVDPLTPLDSAVQPYENGLIDIENETQATRDGAVCIVREARTRRIYPIIVSGYRPPAYQTHIREVYDKWQLLENNNDPACADTKRQVEFEFKRHSKFSYQPGNTSRHSSGLAVDIHLSDYTDADTIAAGCTIAGGGTMSRPVPNDRSHFESPR
jgi:D-alanyl-D-alanine carboxypeptidase